MDGMGTPRATAARPAALLALLALPVLLAGCATGGAGRSARSVGSFRAASPDGGGGAVVVMYHRFDEPHPSTSVSRDMLLSHLDFFERGGFSFVSLADLVRSLRGDGPTLPDKSVAVTLDDAYRSAWSVAHPVLAERGVPYTVFVNTEGIDQGLRDYMTWDQLRDLARSPLVSLESHGHAHAHMVRDMDAGERARDVRTSVSRLFQETGRAPRFFSYPYGETSREFIEEVRGYRWTVGGRPFRFLGAFTTASGPAGPLSDPFALPRFALNMRHGRVGAAFRHKMESLPFPAAGFEPDDRAFCAGDGVRAFSVTAAGGGSLAGLGCFATNGEARVEVRGGAAAVLLDAPLGLRSGVRDTRERINCTLPAGRGRFHWLGGEFSVLDC